MHTGSDGRVTAKRELITDFSPLDALSRTGAFLQYTSGQSKAVCALTYRVYIYEWCTFLNQSCMSVWESGYIPVDAHVCPCVCPCVCVAVCKSLCVRQKRIEKHIAPTKLIHALTKTWYVCQYPLDISGHGLQNYCVTSKVISVSNITDFRYSGTTMTGYTNGIQRTNTPLIDWSVRSVNDWVCIHPFIYVYRVQGSVLVSPYAMAAARYVPGSEFSGKSLWCEMCHSCISSCISL